MIDTIIRILAQQVNSYEQLYELLKKERKCLYQYDVEEFVQIAKEKDSLITQLILLEEERVRLMEKFFSDKGVQGEMNITTLWKLTGNSELISIKDRLRSLLQSIEELNECNRVLINRTLNYLKTSSSFFQNVSSSINSTSSGFLSREA